MGCHVIKNFVLMIAHDDALNIAAPDCQFFSFREYSLYRRAASRDIKRLLCLRNCGEQEQAKEDCSPPLTSFDKHHVKPPSPL